MKKHMLPDLMCGNALLMEKRVNLSFAKKQQLKSKAIKEIRYYFIIIKKMFPRFTQWLAQERYSWLWLLSLLMPYADCMIEW